MDQSAFRAFLTSSTPRESSSSTLGGGSRKRGRDGNHLPSASSTSSEQFRPRAAGGSGGSGSSGKKGQDKNGKGKSSSTVEEDSAEKEPSYKRYGYTDRASMRRAGLEDEERVEEQEERRPRGLDLSLLDASKRALLTGQTEEPAVEEDTPSLPQKTDEEVERELEEAGTALQGSSNNDTEAAPLSTSTSAPPPPAKKQKRSRADMLRDLQAKIAAASSGQEGSKEDMANAKDMNARKDSGSSKQQVSESEPAPQATIRGFKVINRDEPEKKKKKKKRKDEGDGGTIEALNVKPEHHVSGLVSTTEPTEGQGVPIDTDTISTSLAADGNADDADDDIFGGAGDYDDGLSADEEGEAEEGEVSSSLIGLDGKPRYFENEKEDEPLIPHFETYRSPSPPRASSTRRQTSRSPPPPTSTSSPATGDFEEEETSKSRRLQGFSDSTYTAKDLLAYDDYQLKEEKRKLKRLKGKEKREAMEAQKEREGGKDDRDKLNREFMEYENYEKKKAARRDQE